MGYKEYCFVVICCSHVMYTFYILLTLRDGTKKSWNRLCIVNHINFKDCQLCAEATPWSELAAGDFFFAGWHQAPTSHALQHCQQLRKLNPWRVQGRSDHRGSGHHIGQAKSQQLSIQQQSLTPILHHRHHRRSGHQIGTLRCDVTEKFQATSPMLTLL